MRSPYAVGARLKVRIDRMLPFGLLVRLPDDTEGLIRRRELAWHVSNDKAWQPGFKAGDVQEAIVLHQRKHYLELSLRLVERDPWCDIQERYWLGRWIDGNVTGVVSYGVFIQLEPGVTGLLHRSNLPTGGQAEERFWVGDGVRVAISTLDVERRRIGLTLAGLSEQRWRGRQAKGGSSSRRAGDAGAEQGKPESLLPLTLASHQRPLHILVVEDSRSERESLCNWLVHAGQRVSSAADVEEARRLCSAAAPDIMLTDMELRHDVDGIGLIREVMALRSDVRCALMSDWSNLFHHTGDLTELRKMGVEIIPKPLRPDDLLELLSRQGRRAQEQHAVEESIEETVEEIVDVGKTSSLPASGFAGIEAQLTQARHQLDAHKIVLFELDTNRRQIGVRAEVGGTSIHHAYLPELIHSPVRDVAEDGQAVVIQNMENVGRYARKLRPAVACEACIGQPVITPDGVAYALFAFFKQSGAVTDLTRQFMQAYGLTLGAVLSERHLLQKTASLQRVALMGYMTQMLVHEINHHLTPMSMALYQMSERCRAVQSLLDETNAATVDGPGVQRELSRAADTLGMLNKSVADLTEKSRLFGRMMIHDAVEMNRIDHIIERSVDLLCDQAAESHVQIVYKPPEHLLFTRLRATHVQQVVLNTLLNAIQQIAHLRPERGGCVQIRVQATAEEGEPYIQILVEDDGPGIHRRLWQKIFELGYTTRAGEGSGLGLYLARQLLADLGGTIRVAQSQILWGTIIEIVLPISIGGSPVGR